MTGAQDLISTFMVAVSNCSLYSKDHDAFDDLAKRFQESIASLLKEKLEIMILDNELIVNNAPLRKAGLHKINIMKRFRRKGISRVDFLKGISLSEIKQFIIDMASPGKELKSFPHIQAGVADLIHAENEREDDQWDSATVMKEVKNIIHSASDSNSLNAAKIEDIVIHFISAVKRQSNILHYISPVKSFSEYTYTHASNVAMLSLFQAESLGIENDVLHDIGIAGILHDAGKLFISKDILEKKGRLDEDEFNVMKRHPMLGARYLANFDDIPRLASIVAFEHHQKYNLSGYPGVSKTDKKQHICSQIVAIADFFDALRSRRPYRESMDMKDIFVLMRQGAGTDFNPVLLDHFISSVERSLVNS